MLTPQSPSSPAAVPASAAAAAARATGGLGNRAVPWCQPACRLDADRRANSLTYNEWEGPKMHADSHSRSTEPLPPST